MTASAWDELKRDLGPAVLGQVRFDAGARALYATDGSNSRMLPIGVVTPVDVEEVCRPVAVCARHEVPVPSRTSLAGQCCNGAVVLDIARHLDRILELDPAARTARVQPGVGLDRLRAAAERHHLTFGPDPAPHGPMDERARVAAKLAGGRRGRIVQHLSSLAERHAARIRERAHVPAVRAAADDALPMTNGLSRREHVVQETGRHALRLADVLAMARARCEAGPEPRGGVTPW